MVEYPAAAWDLLPTFLELAGAPPPDRQFPGVSLVPALTGDGELPAHERPLYWELPLPPLMQAVRLGDWKLVRTVGETEILELFDLSADPAESRNLSQERPEVAAELVRRIGALRVDDPNWPLERYMNLPASKFEERPPGGYEPRLPATLPAEGPFLLVEIDPPRNSYYRSHIYYWSQGRMDNLELYGDTTQPLEKEGFFEALITSLEEKHSEGRLVFARHGTRSPANQAFERGFQRLGRSPLVVHRYTERYSPFHTIELVMLHRSGE